MKPIPLKTYLIAILSLITLVSFVSVVLIVYPTYQNIQSMKRDVRNIKELVERTYQRSTRLRRSLQEITSVAEAIKRFRSAKILKGTELSVIAELESMAEKYSLAHTLTVKDIPERDRLPISFIAQGTFRNQIAFLSALEQSPYYVLIKQLKWGDGSLSFDAILYVSPASP